MKNLIDFEESKGIDILLQSRSISRCVIIGDIEVCTDAQTRAQLWREAFEKYYPKGVDPDYCVLKLTVKHGSH